MLTGAVNLPAVGARVRLSAGPWRGQSGTVVRHDATPTGTLAAVRIDGAGPEVRVRGTDLLGAT